MFEDFFDGADIYSNSETPIVPDVDLDPPTATNGMTIVDNIDVPYVNPNQE